MPPNTLGGAPSFHTGTINARSMIRSCYRGRRRATELVGLTLAQALLTAACGSTAPPYIQGTVQAEVRATLAATRRAATTQSQSASVAPSPPPSVEAGPPAPSPLASAAIRPSTLPSPAE